MKVTLIVLRDPDTQVCWVEDAVDEYTMDEWGGGLPVSMQEKVDRDPANTRLLVLEVPADALERPFSVPTVKAEVVQ